MDLAHPNLVRLGELLEEDGQLFFTMELVVGTPFVDHVRGGEPRPDPVSTTETLPPEQDTAVHPVQRPARGEARAHVSPGELDEARLRPALAQLARGLLALHASGRVHRDIKPSNVLVTAEGRVVILDFGLVTEPTDTLAEEEEHVVGTAHFMAPEQAAGRSVGPAADWYAVGVMLYEALAGVLPFEVASDAVASLKQSATPPPPGAVVPGVPPDLDALAMRLLVIDPAERAGGDEILRVLGERRSSAAMPVTAVGFVGRRRELDEMEGAFAAALRGEVRALVVEGESGVGKSALVRAFVERAGERALVLAARCYERESVPYKAVDGIVDRLGPHLARLPATDLAAVLPDDIRLAAAVFPVLAMAGPSVKPSSPPPSALKAAALGDHGLVLDLLDEAELADEAARHTPMPAAAAEALLAAPLPPRGVPDIEPAEVRARVFAAMRSLFAALAERRPLVLAVDDLQWADADSLALLSEILRVDPGPEGAAEAARSPILLVASARTSSEARRPEAPRLAIAPQLVRALHLARLPPDEARDLVELLLRSLADDRGGDAAIDASSLDLAALLAETRGHPLFLDALVRHRLASADASAPARLDDALWAGIGELSPRARMLLAAISLACGPLPRRVAEYALSAEPEELDRLAATLRAEHFARTCGPPRDEALEPYHDRVRETVAARIDEDERRTWHARLALALETTGHGAPEALGVHWRGAGDPARASGYAARAGDEAAAAFAFDRAARLYQDALALLPEGAPERPGLLVRLGDARSHGGRGREAAEAYVAAAELHPEAASLELRRRAAESFLRSGYIDEGMSHLRAALADVGVDFPETSAAALAALLLRRAELRLRGLGYTARPVDAIPIADLRRADVCWSAAQGLGMVDSLRGSYFQVRALLCALATGEPYRVARSLALEVGFVATAGPSQRARADELVRAARGAAERSRHPHAFAMVTALSGVRLFLEGRFREALPLLHEGEHLLRSKCLNTAWEIGSTLTFQLWSLWWLGDFRALSDRIPAVLREAEERGDRYLATNLGSGYPNAAWLVAGDPDAAAARAASAIGAWSRGGAHVQHFHDVVARVHIDLYRGDGAAAHRHIAAGWSALDESMSLRIQVVHVTCEYLRGASAIAAAQDAIDPAPLLGVATRSARKLDAERVAWAAPLAAILRAAARAREGERGTAVTSLLEEAARGAAACGMEGYAAAARRALGLARGGEDGAAMVAEAEADLAARGVKEPARLANMLAPGFDG